ncbi:phosphatidylserine decarboxylase [Streptomyces sp. UNOB3_S3]|uniref:phosphatidylserine decarboxylase n=1 Tax=Streptomyces sp. UNOB3_S3 TaxID=2871682 RepID=UPI001E5A1304|nr:phosphatidylserine decarboxylase [Streptomyces sp. UNOB3_S3]MCC3776060.1 phosphatidylserine decarboxylase [Streptomyces sp. UNOB3_S3]
MTTAFASTTVIDELREKLDQDKVLHDLLTDSLKQACTNAKGKLKGELFEALEWPQDVPGYLDYLDTFSRWAPRQDPGDAWSDDKNGQQEVYDRLCHFYYLVDQKIDGKILQNDPWFKGWLVRYAKAWGSFLDTTASFSEEQLDSFHLAPRYRVEDSMVGGKPNEPSGWLTFNQFFARELNPGLRPIADPELNTTVTMPADCSYKQMYPIDDHSIVHPTDGPLRLKLTHEVTSIPQLLSDRSKYGKKFAGGTFVHYFLAPYSYHRFHTPVAGQVKECFPIHGNVYLDVDISNEGQFDAPDSSVGGYEFTQARGVIVIDTTGSRYGDVGLVAVIPVGMAQVSSVHMTMNISDAQIPKGEEFGYFLFGGSDIILLFQKGRAPEINTDGGYRLYGTSVAEPPPLTEL